jgi:AraC-like DNA-binding protein
MHSLQVHPLFRSDTVSISDVRCRRPTAACGGEEQAETHQLVFTRAGVFAKRAGGEPVLAEPTRVLFFNRGECFRVSHPVGAGDDCTVFSFALDVILDACRLLDDRGPRPESPFPVSCAAIEPAVLWRYQHLRRGLVQGGTTALESEERAIGLLESALSASNRPGRRGAAPTHGRTARRRLEQVETVRLELASRPGAQRSLRELAGAVGCSPFHLSRVFRGETGVTVHQYLLRLRLAAALERLTHGERNLSGLACDLGFSSHSHLTRMFRQVFGTTPSAFRWCGGRHGLHRRWGRARS